MSNSDNLAQAYKSAYEAVLFVRHDPPGVIELRGKDRVDLLHRLSTNDLEGLQPGRIAATVFTDPVGRTIDVVTVLSQPQFLSLLTSTGRTQALRDWLQRHIFFQDDVTLHVPEGEWSLYGAYGPEASRSLPAGTPVEGALSDTAGDLIWATDRPVAGYLRLMPPDSTELHWEIEPDSAGAYEILRIEAGLPKMGVEILEDSIPLEVGLWDAVSFSKGCYVGQEIIARMESRGKLAKQLMGVRLKSSAEPGTTLRQSNRTVATLTSVAKSPALGWIGLASGRPGALDESDGQVTVGDTGEVALLVELPLAIPESRVPHP